MRGSHALATLTQAGSGAVTPMYAVPVEHPCEQASRNCPGGTSVPESAHGGQQLTVVRGIPARAEHASDQPAGGMPVRHASAW